MPGYVGVHSAAALHLCMCTYICLPSGTSPVSHTILAEREPWQGLAASGVCCTPASDELQHTSSSSSESSSSSSSSSSSTIGAGADFLGSSLSGRCSSLLCGCSRRLLCGWRGRCLLGRRGGSLLGGCRRRLVLFLIVVIIIVLFVLIIIIVIVRDGGRSGCGLGAVQQTCHCSAIDARWPVAHTCSDSMMRQSWILQTADHKLAILTTEKCWDTQQASSCS